MLDRRVLGYWCFIIVLVAGQVAMVHAQASPQLQAMTQTITKDHPREFIYTDKGAAHLSGEAVGPDTRSYHGFYIAMHELMDGWDLRLEDGTQIGPNTTISADVRPDYMTRHHEIPSGEIINETVQLFDRENGFRVTWSNVPAGGFEVLPRVDMRFLWRVPRPGYEVRWEDGVLLICRQDQLNKTPDPEHPHWLAIAIRGATGFTPDGTYVDTTYPKGQARKAMDKTSPYLPGAVEGRIPARAPSGSVEMICAADVSAEAAIARARRLRTNAGQLLWDREKRLQKLVDDSLILTGVPRDDIALAWARISLDNLIMEQRGLGIYAGFYWFTTYWGRDTFITLPGSSISSGDFATSEAILRSFAEFQETDPTSDREGRLPNFVTVEQVQYASIDGTWWFTRALDELWRRSGNDEFAREMAPVVFRAVGGAFKHATDNEGFLVHGDGETWMDAGGEEHPYSPRGNRAVEVQALWHRGLLTAARLAERFPEQAPMEYTAEACQILADKVAKIFHEQFWDGDRLVDHLNVDGSQDHQIRPNGLLAVMSSPTLFTAEQRQAIIDMNGAELIKPWGVLSLNEADPAFHPKHLNLTEYYYDEAYHNGDLWLWLSGAWVSAQNDPRQGFGQTRMLLDEIMDEGAAGTLQEIRDGAKAESNDEFGGATSQAWSLAELLRNVVDDYLGLKADLTQAKPKVIFKPSVPEAWPALSVRSRIGEVDCLAQVDTATSRLTVYMAQEPPADWSIEWVDSSGKTKKGQAQANPNEEKAWPIVINWK